MTAGRPRKPTATKKRQGTYKAHRAAKNEAQPRPEAPEPPAILDLEARREWDRIVPELLALGLLSRIDRAALAGYCEAWSRWLHARAVLDAEGWTVTTKRTGVIRARPEVGILERAAEHMRRFLVEFGMTPAARSKVEAAPQGGQDDAEVLLFGREAAGK